MQILFYIAGIVAIASTVMVITRTNAIHALLNLIVSLLAVALIFFILGAPFIAALEVIIYAGAIMVLFIFVVMLLNVTREGIQKESKLLNPSSWIIPGILTAVLLIELLLIFIGVNQGLYNHAYRQVGSAVISPKQVGISLFTKYALGVEMAGILLMAGIVGAYHLGKGRKTVVHRYLSELTPVKSGEEETKNG